MLSQEELKRQLHYNPDTGIFAWSTSRSGVKLGKTAGCITSLGYLSIGINKTPYQAHRLAWLYMTGEWPKHEIDHINGIRNDNRFNNLRAANRSENAQNLRAPNKNNKTGFLGVSVHQFSGLYVAKISINKKRIGLGYFKSPELAHAAYLKAKRDLHHFCNI